MGEEQTPIGAITKQADGCYNSHIRAANTQAKIDYLPNIHNAADAIINPCVVIQGIEIGAGWTRNGETSGKDYVSMSIAAKFGLKKLYANLGKVVGADDSRLNAVIWNPGD